MMVAAAALPVNQTNFLYPSSSESSSDSPRHLDDATVGLDHIRKRSDTSYRDPTYGQPPEKTRKATDAGSNGGGAHGKGRKPISEKRRDQNRRAQQAFRDRKEQRVHDLEIKVAELQGLNEDKDEENANLRQIVEQLRAANEALTSSPSQTATSAPPATDPVFAYESTSTESVDQPRGGLSLQESYLSSMTGFAVSPSALSASSSSSLTGAILSRDTTTPPAVSAFEPGSPTSALSPGTYGTLEDYLALDDGTTVPIGAPVASASPSTSPEVKTPGESAYGEPGFDVDGLCKDFRTNVNCREHALKHLEDADEVDKAQLEAYQRSGDSAPAT